MPLENAQDAYNLKPVSQLKAWSLFEVQSDLKILGDVSHIWYPYCIARMGFSAVNLDVWVKGQTR